MTCLSISVLWMPRNPVQKTVLWTVGLVCIYMGLFLLLTPLLSAPSQSVWKEKTCKCPAAPNTSPVSKKKWDCCAFPRLFQKHFITGHIIPDEELAMLFLDRYVNAICIMLWVVLYRMIQINVIIYHLLFTMGSGVKLCVHEREWGGLKE